jgi:hypothetical protein
MLTENVLKQFLQPDGTTLQDYGRLQLDGELKAKSHEENRYKTRYVFLFDKVMLMCKVRVGCPLFIC